LKEIFISGEKINLCIPNDGDFLEWSSWFNSQIITAYLEQGKFPNTPEMQKIFYYSEIDKGRFIAMIKSKNKKLLGVISLSEINYEKNRCQIALVYPLSSRSIPLAPLEAMALATEHAFKRFGMDLVWAGQPFPQLKKWSQRLEIIGYKCEGIVRSRYKHGSEIGDGMLISITNNDYINLINRRNGHLWLGHEKMQKILSKLRKNKSIADLVHDNINDIYSRKDSNLEEIEKSYKEK